MADSVTISSGINVGTEGNDELNTLEWQRNVEEQRDETTVYKDGIEGLGGDDRLTNNGGYSNVKLDGGTGNDTILNNVGGENVSFLGGDGNDYIENGTYDNRLNNALVDGGTNDDTILNYGDNASINAGAGNDSIYSVGKKATISGGDDNDSISNYGDDSAIDGGNGNDYLGAWGSNVTVRGGAGNDSLNGGGDNEQDRASNILFDGANGNNRFTLNYTTNGTINAGAGDDTVSSEHNQKILINVGAGNNSVTDEYDNDVTIQAAGGNNSINLQDSSNILIDAGDGANYVNIENVNDSTASGYTINAGTGADSIQNGGDNVIINAGDGNNSIVSGGYRGGNNVTITSGSGNDFINNYYSTEYAKGARQENAIINAGAGNDTVTNSGNKTTIDGGDGNDEISSYDGTNVLISGGAGSDTIFLANGTVDGGAGDDSLSVGENVLIQYTAGAGSDTIRGFNANSTLSIGGGNYSSAVSGSDVVLTVGNGKITLSEAATLDNLNIVGDTTAGDTTAGDTTLADTVKAAVVADMILHRTEAGYPVIAGLAFHPEEYHGDEPTNYAAKENWSITSKDGLELNGIHYTPENSNDKWVIIIHGYGHNHKHMYPFAGFYLANGYNVLMVDQRAAGDSEGEWLTMGAAESQDIALWTQEIARRNSDAKITLFGVSMGSATAMLAASRSDIKNVTSLVEDCGYTNMMDVVRLLHSNIPAMQSLLSAQDLPVLDTVASVFTGYNLSDAAPLDSISNAKMPSLFITGTEDAVVPVSALTALYDASGADVKEQFIVQGATHGVAGLYDPVGYSNTTFRFLAEANGEGWVTENITDDILLRGTKYGDSIGNSGDNVTIDTYAGNDIINNSGEKVLIYGDEGNDSIYASGANTTIDGGAGSNYISVTGSQGLYVVFDGNTTVQGFNTGFGNGSDTVYIPGNPAGVDFKSGVLTFYGDNDTLTLSDVTTTAKINLYHESRNMLNKGVFIADNDWYSVESSDLSVKSGEEVYFVGPSANPNHGVDFSGISSALNLTLDTAYIDSEDYVPGTTTWINGVYSIRGGAGLTTITGSKLSDTIISGTGRTTINARGGDDYISLTSARALVNYASGDGNDTIQGFNANSTLNISGEKYSSVASGNDLVLSVGSDKITLKDAATLDNLNIIGNAGNTGLEIENSADHTIVIGTANNDSIINTGRRVTVRGLAGDDYLVNIIDSSVTAESAVANLFEGGDGNDTIYSYHSYHPTLLGGNGNDRIIVNRGHMNYIDGGAGNDSILGRTTDSLESNDWAMGGYATLLGGDGNDYIDPFYTNNSTIDGGAGNDTIIANGLNATIDAGDGNNLIRLTDFESGKTGKFIVLNGNTTVENFGTGFGEVTDTIATDIYPGVDFKAGGLTFYGDTDSLTLSDVKSTAKVNLYYTFENRTQKGVFISDNDWYKVQDSDLSVASGEGLYFVGATAKMNHGVDFSDISQALNITLDTDYEANPAFYINNVYSIRGGAGLTTITGSDKNDTIITGTGDTTINASVGNDNISLGSAKAFVEYASGDGNDLIQGFNENSTLNITGAKYFSVASGDDMILFVGNDRLTLKGADTLETVNIIGNYDAAAESIISNSDNMVSVTGTSANDTIMNTGNRVTIQGLAGNDSIISNGSNVLIYGDTGNDIIFGEGSNISIDAGDGNDTISASSTNGTISGGEGSNRISVSGSQALNVVLDGKTTVAGFKTGFGSGADTLIIDGESPSCNFTASGLSLYYDGGGDKIVLGDVTETAKLNLYYSAKNRLVKEVFIAEYDIYTVTDSDLDENNLYFVGATASKKHGIDFSNISRSVNVTLNTDYEANPSFWVNNVHSIIGGAGLTTITGSDEADTIIAGTGNTTINASDGNDNISLSSAKALVEYTAGDGNDLIQGFNENSTLNITGAVYTSSVSGDNVIVTVDDNRITLTGAAKLDTLNIVGKTEGEDDYYGGDKTISDYDGQPINFSETFVASAFENGNFLVQSSTGLLTVENVTNKIVDLRDENGNVLGKAYTPAEAGVIDGRGVSGYQIIEGSSTGTDVIFAGNDGSSLWGGAGTYADALVGGEGSDIFISGRLQGLDNIFAASANDVVNLVDTNLSDIVGTLGNDNSIAIGFNTGTVINIHSTDTLSAAINLADGSSWRFNHVTKSWQSGQTQSE